MAAMHWEARRKQVVLDRKFEYQDRIKRTQRNDSYYNEANIRQIADEMSRDVATPLPSMLSKSFAKLARRSASAQQQKSFEEKLFNRTSAQERKYSAKIPNRYNSTSYTQQY